MKNDKLEEFCVSFYETHFQITPVIMILISDIIFNFTGAKDYRLYTKL